MRVHYLQHVFFESIGYMETWLKENNCQVTSTRFYETDYQLPPISDIDTLIVMGGPMSVYDEAQYPWLKEEKTFISDFIRSGKKILGICLGAQLISVCLGANVIPAENPEIGWFPVTPTKECSQLPWFYELFKNNPTVFHWHGEQFEVLDNGSLNLLSSEANTNQAFYYNENVLGLQFHLEYTKDWVKLLLENAKSDLKNAPYIQTAEYINSKTEYIAICNKIMSEVLNNWFYTH